MNKGSCIKLHKITKELDILLSSALTTVHNELGVQEGVFSQSTKEFCGGKKSVHVQIKEWISYKALSQGMETNPSCDPWNQICIHGVESPILSEKFIYKEYHGNSAFRIIQVSFLWTFWYVMQH